MPHLRFPAIDNDRLLRNPRWQIAGSFDSNRHILYEYYWCNKYLVYKYLPYIISNLEKDLYGIEDELTLSIYFYLYCLLLDNH